MDKNRNIHEGKVHSGVGVTNFVSNYIRELDNQTDKKPTFIDEKD